MPQVKIAELFGVKKYTINRINRGRSWSYYTHSNPFVSPFNHNLTPEELVELEVRHAL